MFEPPLQLLDDIELDWSSEQDDEAGGLHHCWRLTGNPGSSQTSLPSQHLHATFQTASQSVSPLWRNYQTVIRYILTDLSSMEA